MKTIDSELPFFKALLQMLSLQFGSNCEVILHDWSRGYDKSILLIENGEITGRKVGDSGSNLGLEVMRGTTKDGDRFNYTTHTKDGKILKSSTMYIKDDDGKALGAICINLDVTSAIKTTDFLNELINGSDYTDENKVDEFFATDVSELLDYFIEQALIKVNKPLDDMTKEDKLIALRYLDEKGALLITKSGTKICKVLGISKFTLYNYLDEIRTSNTK